MRLETTGRSMWGEKVQVTREQYPAVENFRHIRLIRHLAWLFSIVLLHGHGLEGPWIVSMEANIHVNGGIFTRS